MASYRITFDILERIVQYYQTLLEGIDRGPGAAGQIHLREEMGDVRIHRELANYPFLASSWVERSLARWANTFRSRRGVILRSEV